MKLVVLMTLAAVAMGRPPLCEDYCRTIWFTTQLPPPWDPSCDCTKLQIPVETYNGKPVYTATTIFKLDNTGVYFEPAKIHQDDGVTYINQPFYVVNSMEEFLTRPPMTAHNKASAGIQVRLPNTALKTDKYKNKNTVSFGDSNEYKSYSNSYGKEELPETKTNYKTKDHGSNDDSNKTGKSLSKCVDLYNMAVSRIYNNGSELAKIWGKSKYHKFNKLSDEDLMVTMQQECQGTEGFVKTRANELLNKKPKKKVVSNKKSSSQTKQNKPSVEPNYTAKTESEYSGPPSNGGADNFKTSGLSGSEENNPFPVQPTDISSTLLADVSVARAPTQDATRPDEDPAFPIAEPFETLAPNVYDINHPSTDNDEHNEGKYLFKNLTVYNKMHEINAPQWIPIYDLITVLYDDDANKEIINKAIETYPNSTITSAIETATVAFAKNRSRYNENEVPPARVITREFAEDHVDSVINGTEDLQRDDTTDKVDEEPDQLPTSVTRGPGFTVQMEIDDQQITMLTGILYFRFGEDYIPAKFFQKSNGKLRVAIDAAIICGKENLERDNKNIVLAALCDRFNNKNN